MGLLRAARHGERPERETSVATHSVLKDHQTLRRRAVEIILRVAEIADEDGGTVAHQPGNGDSPVANGPSGAVS
jgi:hypothetical protein